VRVEAKEHEELSGCGQLGRCGWIVRRMGGCGVRAGEKGGRGGEVEGWEERWAAKGEEESRGQPKVRMEAEWTRPWLVTW
jgi:hypothetical protein